MIGRWATEIRADPISVLKQSPRLGVTRGMVLRIFLVLSSLVLRPEKKFKVVFKIELESGIMASPAAIAGDLMIPDPLRGGATSGRRVGAAPEVGVRGWGDHPI